MGTNKKSVNENERSVWDKYDGDRTSMRYQLDITILIISFYHTTVEGLKT